MAGVAFVAVLVLVQLYGAFTSAYAYDEAYNLQIVGNLLAGHGYATDGVLFTGRPQEFDFFITTGPTVMLPVAGAAALLGEHMWVYRLVPVLGFLGLLAATALLGRRAGGTAGAWVAVLTLCALDVGFATTRSVTDSPFRGPGEVLGEYPGAALLVVAALLTRRPFLSGVAVGLAVLAKTVALIAVPGIAVGVVVAAALVGAGRRRALLSLAAGIGAPLAAWQLVRVVAMGPETAMTRNGEFLRFLLVGGSGVGGTDHATTTLERVSALAPLVSWFGVAAVVVALGHRWAVVRRREHPPTADPAVVAALLGGALVLTWWLFVADHAWTRHSLLGVLLVLPTLLAWCLSSPPVRSRRHHVVAVVVAVLLGAASVSHAVHTLHPPGPSVSDQERVVETVREHGGEMTTVGWHQNPELLLYPGITASAPGTVGPLLVLSTRDRDLDRHLRSCDRVLLRAAEFVVCETRPADLDPADAAR